jgi:hypothetical protein
MEALDLPLLWACPASLLGIACVPIVEVDGQVGNDTQVGFKTTRDLSHRPKSETSDFDPP